MSKLIQKYKDNPSHKMLIKIAEYSKKHPFAWIMRIRKTLGGDCFIGGIFRSVTK
jgi:hypothetical protein